MNYSYNLSESSIKLKNESKIESIDSSIISNEYSLIRLIDGINQPKYIKLEELILSNINDNKKIKDLNNIKLVKPNNININKKIINKNIIRNKKIKKNSDKGLIKFLNSNQRLILPSYKNKKQDNVNSYEINNYLKEINKSNNNKIIEKKSINKKNISKCNSCINSIKKISAICTIRKLNYKNYLKTNNSPTPHWLKNEDSKGQKREETIINKKTIDKNSEERKNECNLKFIKYINTANNNKKSEKEMEIFISTDIINQKSFKKKINSHIDIKRHDINKDINNLRISNNNFNIIKYIINNSSNKYNKEIEIANHAFKFKKSIPKNNIYNINEFKKYKKIDNICPGKINIFSTIELDISIRKDNEESIKISSLDNKKNKDKKKYDLNNEIKNSFNMPNNYTTRNKKRISYNYFKKGNKKDINTIDLSNKEDYFESYNANIKKNKYNDTKKTHKKYECY